MSISKVKIIITMEHINENPKNELMSYMSLELISLERNLTMDEKEEQEQIQITLNLSRREILEKGKENILS